MCLFADLILQNYYIFLKEKFSFDFLYRQTETEAGSMEANIEYEVKN